jgi:hypothetical protein
MDGNFDPIRKQQGLSISDWLCLRFKSSSLRGLMGFVRVGTLDPWVADVKFPGTLQYNSIHSAGI